VSSSAHGPTDLMHKEWLRQLSGEALGLVGRILGKCVPELLSPELRVRRYWAAAPSFSISLGGGDFVCLESDWDDTPAHAIDYHTMEITVLDHPKDIPRTFDEQGRKRIKSPVSVVDIGAPKSPVISVTVLEHEENCGTERVRYDSGLIFRLADERRFAIMVHQSIAGGLECATEPIAIDEVLAEDRVRLVLE